MNTNPNNEPMGVWSDAVCEIHGLLVLPDNVCPDCEDELVMTLMRPNPRAEMATEG